MEKRFRRPKANSSRRRWRAALLREIEGVSASQWRMLEGRERACGESVGFEDQYFMFLGYCE